MFGFSIPWKLVAAGLASLAIMGAIYAGYSYVTSMQNSLIAARVSAQTERIARKSWEAATHDVTNRANQAAARVERLERERRDLDDQTSKLQADLDQLRDQIGAPNAKAKDLAAALNAAAARLNRVLEQQSRGPNPSRPDR